MLFPKSESLLLISSSPAPTFHSSTSKLQIVYFRRKASLHTHCTKCAGGSPKPPPVPAQGAGNLPAQLRRARQLRTAGLVASAVVLAAGGVAGVVSGLAPPEVPEWLAAAVIAPPASAALALAGAKAVLGDRLWVEWHRSRLHIEMVLRNGQFVKSAAIEVRPTGDARGNGAYACCAIRAGTCVGDYEGEMLDEPAYWMRYPDGSSEYCIGIDDMYTLDAVLRAKDVTAFSPCHMNHSAKRFNTVRHTRRKEKRVTFYTARDIELQRGPSTQCGEELLIDYGRMYWTDREYVEFE